MISVGDRIRVTALGLSARRRDFDGLDEAIDGAVAEHQNTPDASSLREYVRSGSVTTIHEHQRSDDVDWKTTNPEAVYEVCEVIRVPETRRQITVRGALCSVVIAADTWVRLKLASETPDVATEGWTGEECCHAASSP